MSAFSLQGIWSRFLQLVYEFAEDWSSPSRIKNEPSNVHVVCREEGGVGSGVEGLREVLDRSKICLYLSNRFSPSSKTTLQHGASSMCRWCSLFAALEYKLLSSYMPSQCTQRRNFLDGFYRHCARLDWKKAFELMLCPQMIFLCEAIYSAIWIMHLWHLFEIQNISFRRR